MLRAIYYLRVIGYISQAWQRYLMTRWLNRFPCVTILSASFIVTGNRTGLFIYAPFSTLNRRIRLMSLLIFSPSHFWSNYDDARTHCLFYSAVCGIEETFPSSWKFLFTMLKGFQAWEIPLVCTERKELTRGLKKMGSERIIRRRAWHFHRLSPNFLPSSLLLSLLFCGKNT